MGLLDLSLYKVTNNSSNVDATTQDSMIDAIQAVVNALTNANIDAAAAIALSKLAGYPGVAGKYADGQGNWSAPTGTLCYRKTSTTDIFSATSGDLSAGALVIAAGAMGANGIVKVSAWGDYLNNTGSSQSVGIRLAFGSDAGQTNSLTAASSASRVPWFVDWYVNNLGVTNSQQKGGVTQFQSPNAPFSLGNGSAMAVDTTASVTLGIIASLGVSNAALSMRCHGALVQVFTG